MIQTGDAQYVAENMGKFKGANHNQIVEKLSKAWKIRYVAQYLENFKGLEKSVKEELLYEWFKKEVNANPQAFEEKNKTA